MAPEPEREILVIHPGALGDVLQALPALRALGRLEGGCRLALAAQPRIGRLLAGAGEVDEALAFDGLGLEALFAGEPPPPALAARLARVGRVVSWFAANDARYRGGLRALAPCVVVAAPAPDDSFTGAVWQHLLATLGAWHWTSAPSLFPIRLPAAWRAQAREALAGLGARPGRPILAVHPGAGGAWKRWPAGDLARVVLAVARETGCHTVVHEGPADSEAAAALLEALRGGEGEAPVLRLLEPDLPLLAGVLQASAAFLGADSGVSHVAAAVGAPALILFPAATRERWAPWSPTALPLLSGAPESEPDRVAQAVLARIDSSCSRA